MIIVICYVGIALILYFAMLLHNNVNIWNPEERGIADDDAFDVAVFWPFVFCILVIVAPFWAVSSLAKWFGRNYL
jgi:hypothetical protein